MLVELGHSTDWWEFWASLASLDCGYDSPRMVMMPGRPGSRTAVCQLPVQSSAGHPGAPARTGETGARMLRALGTHSRPGNPRQDTSRMWEGHRVPRFPARPEGAVGAPFRRFFQL